MKRDAKVVAWWDPNFGAARPPGDATGDLLGTYYGNDFADLRPSAQDTVRRYHAMIHRPRHADQSRSAW